MHSIYSVHSRSWLLALFLDCPLGESLQSCPARGIRKLSLEDKVYITDGLPQKVVEKLLERHHLCLASREANAAEVG